MLKFALNGVVFCVFLFLFFDCVWFRLFIFGFVVSCFSLPVKGVRLFGYLFVYLFLGKCYELICLFWLVFRSFLMKLVRLFTYLFVLFVLGQYYKRPVSSFLMKLLRILIN